MPDDAAQQDPVTLTLILITPQAQAERLVVRLNKVLVDESTHILRHTAQITPLTTELLQALSPTERTRVRTEGPDTPQAVRSPPT